MSVFGNLANMGAIMQQARQMQDNIKQLQQELEEARIEGSAGAGMVRINFNGKAQALSVEIDDEAYKENKTVLQTLITSAINDGMQKRDTLKKAKIKEAMGGAELPEYMLGMDL